MDSLNNSDLQTHYLNSFRASPISHWVRYKANHPMRIRLKILISEKFDNEPVLSRLILDYGLTVNITGANFRQDRSNGWFDLELRGGVLQLQKALAYLQQLDLKILGKANPDGDSW